MNLSILQRSFDEADIKFREQAGKSLAYVKAHKYVERLNEATEGLWSWEINKCDIAKDDIVVFGQLRFPDGIIKQAYGGTTRQLRRDGQGYAYNLADDIKSAATDAFKKACSLLGIGAHLYDEDPTPPQDEDGPQNRSGFETRERQQQPNSNGGSSTGMGPSPKQLDAISAMGAKLGWNRAKLTTEAKKFAPGIGKIEEMRGGKDNEASRFIGWLMKEADKVRRSEGGAYEPDPNEQLPFDGEGM